MNKSFLSFLIFLQICCILGIPTSDIPVEINTCPSSDEHKGIPTPNKILADECKPWTSRSCCTEDRASKISTEDVFNLKYNICKQNLSSSCSKYFQRETCFFECSPNLGLWLLEMKGTEIYQVYQNVPLCKTDCDKWFKACSDDYTCSDNWYKNLQEKKTDDQACQKKNKCDKIKIVFKTAKDFCEKIWNNAYEVANDDEKCMTFTFDWAKGNPNDEVAMYYYNKKKEEEKNSASDVQSNLIYIPLAVFVLKYVI